MVMARSILASFMSWIGTGIYGPSVYPHFFFSFLGIICLILLSFSSGVVNSMGIANSRGVANNLVSRTILYHKLF